MWALSTYTCINTFYLWNSLSSHRRMHGQPGDDNGKSLFGLIKLTTVYLFRERDWISVLLAVARNRWAEAETEWVWPLPT